MLNPSTKEISWRKKYATLKDHRYTASTSQRKARPVAGTAAGRAAWVGIVQNNSCTSAARGVILSNAVESN